MSERYTESSYDHVSTKMRAKAIDKIIGEPTIVTYGILEDQLAVMASTIKTSHAAWGGKHGHLPLVVGTAKYVTITTIDTHVTTRQVKPAAVDPAIDGNTTNFKRLKKTRKWDIKIREFELQEEVDDVLKECIIESVDEQYIDELKKDYVGHADETTKTLLSQIKTTWYKITTR